MLQKVREGGSGILQKRAGLLAFVMGAGGIAEGLAGKFQAFLEDFCLRRACGRPIQI
jgi:hypothetical protein